MDCRFLQFDKVNDILIHGRHKFSGKGRVESKKYHNDDIFCCNDLTGHA